MEHKYDNLSISFLDGNNITYKDIGTGDQNTFDELKKIIASQALTSLNATYGDESWAIDVACEKNLSYIVVLDIKQGITYTYLNPLFLSSFSQDELPTKSNIYVCDDMEKYEADEKNAKSLELLEINGNDCPLLHICEDPDVLYKIVCQFLDSGTMHTDSNWLKS